MTHEFRVIVTEVRNLDRAIRATTTKDQATRTVETLRERELTLLTDGPAPGHLLNDKLKGRIVRVVIEEE
jgi:hypothetical protein